MFFWLNVMIKSNMYTNIFWMYVAHRNFQRNSCCNKKIIKNLMGCLTLISNNIYIYIYIYVCIYHHHHHVVRPAWISLTLSLHVSLSFIASGRSSGLHPVSSHSCCMYVRAGRLAFDWPYAGVHRSTSLTSSSLFLQ